MKRAAMNQVALPLDLAASGINARFFKTYRELNQIRHLARRKDLRREINMFSFTISSSNNGGDA